VNATSIEGQNNNDPLKVNDEKDETLIDISDKPTKNSTE
jgi:hypothetical protein